MSQGLICLDTPAEVNHEFVACRGFEGIWISETGSRYLSDGREFVCLRAHHPDFRGWIGKTAVAGITNVGGGWLAKQAIRNPVTGVLSRWVSVTITINADVVTKFFSDDVPVRLLVHGRVERYQRVQI